MSTTQRHVFVAGASGVIGRRVVRRLVDAGQRVSALTRSPERVAQLAELGAEPLLGDVYDAERLSLLLTAARPDALIHQLTDLADYDTAANARLRREGTANLMAAATAAGVSDVVAQSIAWAYAPTNGRADESTPLDVDADEPRLTTVSAVASLESAVLVAAHGVVLRYGMLYGPDTWFIKGGRRADEALAGTLAADRSVTSFVHVDDAAAAAVAALDWPAGAVNIVDDEPATGTVWVPDFCAYVRAPAPEPTATRMPWANGASNTRAKELGWNPLHPTWRGGWG